MAFNLQEYSVTMQAGEDLSSDQHKFVVQSSGNVIKPTDQTSYAMGILNNIPSDSTTYQIPPVVVLSGVTRLRVNDIYSVGTWLQPQYDSGSAANTGRGMNASGSLKYARAVALQASTAADDIIAVRLIDQNPA